MVEEQRLRELEAYSIFNGIDFNNKDRFSDAGKQGGEFYTPKMVDHY